MNKYKFVAVSVLVIVALSGCGTTGTGSNNTIVSTPIAASDTNSYVPQGWVQHNRSADGFSLWLPADFEVYDVTPANIGNTIAQVKNTDPQVAAILEWVKAQPVNPNVPTVLYALDVSKQSRSSGYMCNVRVTKEYHKSKVSLDEYVKSTLEGLAKTDGVQNPVQHEQVKTGKVEFEKIQYDMKIPGYENAVRGYMCIGVNGSTAYILGMSTTTEQAPKYAPIFDQIAQTFQLKSQ